MLPLPLFPVGDSEPGHSRSRFQRDAEAIFRFVPPTGLRMSETSRRSLRSMGTSWMVSDRDMVMLPSLYESKRETDSEKSDTGNRHDQGW